jgi:uncharacterized membrane protein YfcA
MPAYDPAFYAAAIIAVMLVGLGKGAFGGGMGVMAVPLMALFLPPTQVAAIMLPLLCAMDLFGIRNYRKDWDRSAMVILAPAILAGIVIGALSFRYLNDDAIRFMIGVIAVSFCLNAWIRRKAAQTPAQPNVVKGGFWGAIAGFTSFVAHAGGPPANVYLLPLKLDKSAYVGTSIVLFTLVNYVKLVPYGLLGLFTKENLLTSLALSPLVPLGMYVGFFVHKRLSRENFYRFVYVMLFLVGLKLAYDGATGYLAIG